MKSSLPILAATLLCLTSARAAQVNFKDIASTNVVKTNDLLLVDSALGGTNYATRTAPIARVVGFGVVTNALSMDGDTNKFVNGKGLLTPIYGTVTNLTIAGTNGITIAGATNGTNVTITVNSFGTPATLTPADAGVSIDFNAANQLASITLTGNVTFAFANVSAYKNYKLRVINTQATNCLITFPAGAITNFFGGAPSSLAAGHRAMWSMQAWGATDADVDNAWSATQ